MGLYMAFPEGALPAWAVHEATGWALELFVLCLCYYLHIVLAAPRVTGYACDNFTKRPLVYRINAFRALVVAMLLFFVAVRTDVITGAEFAEYHWPMARCACVAGLAAAAALYLRGAERAGLGLVDRGSACLTTSGPRSASAADTSEFDAQSALVTFYTGYEWNPRPLDGDFDLKMWGYLVGGLQLALHLASALCAHALARNRNEENGGGGGGGDGGGTGTGATAAAAADAAVSGHFVSNAAAAYCLMLGWFVAEYMWFEHVHLTTYDLFRERTGFKLAWGCLCFYPFFYHVGVWPLVQWPMADISPQVAVLICTLFACGWVLTRGANMQKYAHKRGAKTFLGLRQETVPGSNGRILCSGWWGVSRHVNYLGEIVQALALALPGWLATGSLLPWLYPLYYLALFVPRQMDDDAVCEKKYGKAWLTYKALVPYRIAPGLW